MTVSYVGANAAAATSVTIPAHQVGDLILIFAYRDGSNTSPTTPTAGGTVPTWINISSVGSNTNSTNFRYAVATSTTTTSGTWTNATEILCMVYRGASIGANGGTGGASTTISYPAITLQRQDNSSWVVGIAGHRTATNVEVAPSGMTNRISTGTELAGHDSDGTRTNWTAQSVTVNASSGWRSSVVELRDKTVVLTADKGTFTVTGKDATISKVVSRTLTADTGSVAVTRNDANLIHEALLLGSQGTVTGTYNPASVIVSRRLTAAAGLITVNGNNANLTKVKAYTLTSSVGTFSVQGQPAAVRLTRRLTAANRSFTVGLVPATLTRTIRLVASTRAFNVNGIAANIIYTGGSVAEKSLYYQSVVTDPRKTLVSTGAGEDQVVYYVKGFFRIL